MPRSARALSSALRCRCYFPGTEPQGDEAVLLPGPCWVPWVPLPRAAVPATFAVSEVAQFFPAAALSVDVPGLASVPASVRGKRALTA